MKIWFLLFLLVSAVVPVWAQTAPMQMPKRVTWVEDYAHRSARGEQTRTCSVNSKDGSDWRMEITTDEADITISVCRDGKVSSTLSVAPAADAGPVKSVQEIYDAISDRAKFEVVDIMGGVGYSRYRETGPDGYVRLIWMDRATGFPRRVSTTFANGSTLEQGFRIIEVDASTRRRLFDANTLHPFFAYYLDEWHARLTK